MLVAGSPIVRKIHQTQGKQRAMEFASHIVRTANLGFSKQPREFEQGWRQEMEIGD